MGTEKTKKTPKNPEVSQAKEELNALKKPILGDEQKNFKNSIMQSNDSVFQRVSGEFKKKIDNVVDKSKKILDESKKTNIFKPDSLKNFENLSRDRDVKTGLNKIAEKELGDRIKIFTENHNKYSKEKVGYYTARIVKNDPKLTRFIAGELGLPIKTKNSDVDYDFSELSFDQKLKFMALYEANHDLSYESVKSGNYDKKYDAQILIKEYHKWLNKFTEEINNGFIKTMNENKNFGYVNLEKTLKKYGLTDTESKKFKEYLDSIKKLQEDMPSGKKYVEAGFAGGFFTGMIVMAIMGTLGYYALTNQKILDTPETIVRGSSTEITNIREVLEFITQETDTDSTEREFTENGFGHFDTSTGSLVMRGMKRVGNGVIDGINLVQSRKLRLRVTTTCGYVFDFENAKCRIDVDENGKGTVHLKVKKPEVKLLSSEAKVLESSREGINMTKFDDFDIKARESLEQEAIEKAKAPELIEKAKESLGKKLLLWFQKFGCSMSDIEIKGKDFEKIVVEFED